MLKVSIIRQTVGTHYRKFGTHYRKFGTLGTDPTYAWVPKFLYSVRLLAIDRSAPLWRIAVQLTAPQNLQVAGFSTFDSIISGSIVLEIFFVANIIY